MWGSVPLVGAVHVCRSLSNDSEDYALRANCHPLPRTYPVPYNEHQPNPNATWFAQSPPPSRRISEVHPRYRKQAAVLYDLGPSLPHPHQLVVHPHLCRLHAFCVVDECKLMAREPEWDRAFRGSEVWDVGTRCSEDLLFGERVGEDEDEGAWR